MAQKACKVAGGTLCQLCGVVLKSNVRRHMRDIHFDETTYMCPACKTTYRSKNVFSSHISKYHRDWKGIDLDKFALPAGEGQVEGDDKV